MPYWYVAVRAPLDRTPSSWNPSFPRPGLAVVATLVMLLGERFAALQGRRRQSDYMGAIVFKVRMTLFLAPLVVRLLSARIPYWFLHWIALGSAVPLARGLAMGSLRSMTWYLLATRLAV